MHIYEETCRLREGETNLDAMFKAVIKALKSFSMVTFTFYYKIEYFKYSGKFCYDGSFYFYS